jgi:hypothetical protein
VHHRVDPGRAALFLLMPALGEIVPAPLDTGAARNSATGPGLASELTRRGLTAHKRVGFRVERSPITSTTYTPIKTVVWTS